MRLPRVRLYVRAADLEYAVASLIALLCGLVIILGCPR